MKKLNFALMGMLLLVFNLLQVSAFPFIKTNSTYYYVNSTDNYTNNSEINIDENFIILFIANIILFATFFISVRSSGLYKSLISVTGIMFIFDAVTIFNFIRNYNLTELNMVFIRILGSIFILLGIVLIYIGIINLLEKDKK